MSRHDRGYGEYYSVIESLRGPDNPISLLKMRHGASATIVGRKYVAGLLVGPMYSPHYQTRSSHANSGGTHESYWSDLHPCSSRRKGSDLLERGCLENH